jgi:hypothetical protein
MWTASVAKRPAIVDGGKSILGAFAPAVDPKKLAGQAQGFVARPDDGTIVS